jgi:hypothetical protein
LGDLVSLQELSRNERQKKKAMPLKDKSVLFIFLLQQFMMQKIGI